MPALRGTRIAASHVSCQRKPPSAVSSHRSRSEARNTTIFAISSGCPKRPSGVLRDHLLFKVAACDAIRLPPAPIPFEAPGLGFSARVGCHSNECWEDWGVGRSGPHHAGPDPRARIRLRKSCRGSGPATSGRGGLQIHAHRGDNLAAGSSGCTLIPRLEPREARGRSGPQSNSQIHEGPPSRH